MHIRVRFFAYYREQLGRGGMDVEIPDGSDVAALWRVCVGDHASLLGLWDATAVAVNGEYMGRDAMLHDHDEVAFLPPVSGGALRCQLVEDPIDTAALEAAVGAARHGAIVTFLGIVRETSPTGKLVEYLEYEAYGEMALQEMERIAAAVEDRWPGSAVAIVHRTGRLEIGEASVAIAVATPHRAAAFEACHFAIDRLKQTVPIWKKEIFTDGSRWVGVGA
jgi:molybdopterin synthase catalytic subunit/molybdopterin converting factor small subunit